jgi:hypothetical protein
VVASELFPGVYLIKNFLSDSELEFFKKIIESSSEEQWFTGDQDAGWEGRSLEFSVERGVGLVADLYNRTLKMFGPHDKKNLTHFTEISRILVGTKLGTHVDDGKNGPKIKYGGVIYLNDNYDGGEIAYYDNTDQERVVFSYKPKSGDMVVHLASKAHGVLTVTSGTRYMITFFVMGTDSIFVG